MTRRYKNVSDLSFGFTFTQKKDVFSREEIEFLKDEALKKIPLLVKSVSEALGVSYNRIMIRAQKSLWGSCSSKGNLNFNCLLMLLPENIQRYVVVHELCHRKHMNHSAAFWNEVARLHPSYLTDKKQLRLLGAPLIEKLRRSLYH